MDQAIGLVADIGRVSVRFGLSGGPEGAAPRQVERLMVADHSTFTGAMLNYLRLVGRDGHATPSALAVAGAVHGDTVNLTGSRWFISLTGIEAVLRARPRAINECAANAMALTTLSCSDFVSIGDPAIRPPRDGGNFLVVGPGTELGVAGLHSRDGRLTPVESEAAHMAFAATTEAEARVVAHLARKGVRVTNEAMLAACGLVAAHEALSEGRAAPLKPEDVTAAAARDTVACAAVDLYLGALGAVIGDLALAFAAWDGVFITGAIGRALQARLARSGFRDRMEAKGTFRRQLSRVPVAVVTRSDLELIGAAAALGNA